MRRLAAAVVVVACSPCAPAWAEDLGARLLEREAGLAPLAPSAAQPFGDELVLVRRRPLALRLGPVRRAFDLSPHAAFAGSDLGQAAEAGATLRFSLGRDPGGEAGLGTRGRWYLFAAAGARAVGFNLADEAAHGWDQAAWSAGPSSALIGDARVGLGWGEGATQATLGLIRRQTQERRLSSAVTTKNDSLLALSISIKPDR